MGFPNGDGVPPGGSYQGIRESRRTGISWKRPGPGYCPQLTSGNVGLAVGGSDFGLAFWALQYRDEFRKSPGIGPLVANRPRQHGECDVLGGWRIADPRRLDRQLHGLLAGGLSPLGGSPVRHSPADFWRRHALAAGIQTVFLGCGCRSLVRRIFRTRDILGC